MLVPVSLLIVILAIWSFVWSVRTDQYEDLEKEGFRILLDEEFIDEAPLSKELIDEAHVKQTADERVAEPQLLNPQSGLAPTVSLMAVSSENNLKNNRSAS